MGTLARRYAMLALGQERPCATTRFTQQPLLINFLAQANCLTFVDDNLHVRD